MNFDKKTLYVWVYLPNQVSPTLCGRVTKSISVTGAPIGEFV
jgi:hypothetical protein